MKGLAELVVSLCDLCEAEGRLLEAGILRTVSRAGLLSLGLLFGAAALALLLAALYALLTALLPRPAALGLLGCASAAIAGLFLWMARGGSPKSAAPAAAPVTAAKEQPHAGKRAQTRPHESSQASPAGEKGADGHASWAHVAPYGHRARRGESPGAGKGASPEREHATAAHSAAGRENR